MAFVRMCDRCEKIRRKGNFVILNKVILILTDATFSEVRDAEAYPSDICVDCYEDYAELVREWWVSGKEK